MQNRNNKSMDNQKIRCYFVIDMKSFFASVECSERGLNAMTTKLVVADESRSKGTICLAVSPALKEMGVKNRCRLFEIPEGINYIIAPPRMRKYIEYASNIYEIYLKYIDKSDIHVYSIDECFIDATDYLKIYNLKAKDFAKKLMNEIWQKLKIPSSCGIGTNLYLAKIALDITAKHSPDRIGWLTEEKFIQTLWKHEPLTDFWGISTGTVNRLKKFGIINMQGVAQCKEEKLYKEFGINAELLIDHAWGRETCLMSDIKNYKSKSNSVSSSQILPCNYNYLDAKIVLMEMLQNGCYDLFRHKKVTKHFVIIIGYGDNRGEFCKASVTMNETTNLYYIISEYASKLYDNLIDTTRPIRRIGYNFCNVKNEDNEQYNLFTDLAKVKKQKHLTSSIIDVQSKYGKNALLKGLDLLENATQRERNEQIGGHKSG